MAETVSDERLAAIKSSLDYCVNPTSVLGQWTPELIALVSEVIERRAADKDAPEPPLFDKDLVDLVCYYERYIMDNWTDTPDERCRMADATIRALIELQSLRAAEREQAATEPRKPAKWERRLEMMRGTLEKEEIGERRWQCSLCFEGHTFYGPTAKAAVKAAWKAWKEARDAEQVA